MLQTLTQTPTPKNYTCTCACACRQVQKEEDSDAKDLMAAYWYYWLSALGFLVLAYLVGAHGITLMIGGNPPQTTGF